MKLKKNNKGFDSIDSNIRNIELPHLTSKNNKPSNMIMLY